MIRLGFRLCIFSSTADIQQHNFIVNVLTGQLEEIMTRSLEWGYDGIEFLPDPFNVPDPVSVEKALKKTGAAMPVVNTGRMTAQGITLLHEDADVRKQAMEAFKRIIELAGHNNASVGLGMSRGNPAKINEDEAKEIFNELAAYAQRHGAIVMLEPADPGITTFIHTVRESVDWAGKIHSPNFIVMLDTWQMHEVESSFEQAIADAEGLATHIHLYDPSRWPPGVIAHHETFDWKRIAQMVKDSSSIKTGSVVLAPEGDPELTARKSASFLKQFL